MLKPEDVTGLLNPENNGLNITHRKEFCYQSRQLCNRQETSPAPLPGLCHLDN
jgi:hypothetical protein